MDFVADSLFNGRRIRALTVVDNFSTECLAIYADYSISADKVVDVTFHGKGSREDTGN